MLTIMIALLSMPGLVSLRASALGLGQGPSTATDWERPAPDLPPRQLADVADRGAQPPLQATPVPPDDRSRYTRGDSNVTFKWDLLVDTLALLVARFWLCCGGLVVVGISVFFVVLWVKSRNRQQS